jgi:putative ATPase
MNTTKQTAPQAFMMIQNTKVSANLGDLCQETVDVVVNPANTYLQHGGGVAGALARRLGADFQERSDDIVSKVGEVPVGGGFARYDVPTKVGAPFRHVISVVGPRILGGAEPTHEEAMLLYSAVHCALVGARQLGAKTVAVPAISSGIFGYPKKGCAEVLLTATHIFLAQFPDCFQEVRFTNFDQETVSHFVDAIRAFRLDVPPSEVLMAGLDRMVNTLAKQEIVVDRPPVG